MTSDTPQTSSTTADDGDFFQAGLEESVRANILSPRRARVRDLLYDLRLWASWVYWLSVVHASRLPRIRVLVVAVAVPERAGDLERVLRNLSSSRHHVTIVTIPISDRGKFDNVNACLQAHGDINHYDWIVVTDDDIVLPSGFLDLFLYLVTRYDLRLAQPAHRFHSFASYHLTKRQWATLARSTGFVEMGPLTAFHRETFPPLIPFPSLRWGWGLDLYWSDMAHSKKWRIGIIDALPIRHFRQVAGSYSGEAAIAEARRFLAAAGISTTRQNYLHDVEVFKLPYEASEGDG